MSKFTENRFNKMVDQIKFNAQPSTVSGVAKACALIAVDELINETFGNGTGRYKYWTEVKQ